MELMYFGVRFVVSLIDPINIIFFVLVGLFSKNIRQCIIGSIIAGTLLRIFVSLVAMQEQSQISGNHHFAALFSTVCGSAAIYFLSNWFKRQKLKQKD